MHRIASIASVMTQCFNFKKYNKFILKLLVGGFPKPLIKLFRSIAFINIKVGKLLSLRKEFKRVIYRKKAIISH